MTTSLLNNIQMSLVQEPEVGKKYGMFAGGELYEQIS